MIKPDAQMPEGLAAAEERGGGGGSLHPVTKVVTLRAGSVPVKERFDMVIPPCGARVLPASVSQDDTLDAVVFARVNV